MLWFGGYSGQGITWRLPLNSQRIWPSITECWLNGEWPARQTRTIHTGKRAVAVIGPCGMADDELAQLAVYGVPDDVAWRWPGSYTVVQVTDNGTTVWTDAGGSWPTYTLRADGGVYWSSSSRALAGLNNASVDIEWLAAWLLVPGEPALLDDRSAFADVSTVPAGHRLFLPIRANPDAQPMFLPQPRHDDHAQRLRAELAAAVAVRTDTATSPTADLSGGYDSTALALLAAHQLQPDRTITGITVHPAGVIDEGDVRYARQAGQHPGITHRLMALGAEHLPYSRLDALPVTDEPAPSTIAYTRFAAQLRWMREHLGSDCHLTGDGGDSLLCSPPIMLADLIRARRYRRALAEAVAWARLRRVAVWPLLVAAARTARTTRADGLRALARCWRTGRRAATTTDGVGWCASTPIPPWASVTARDCVADLADTLAARPDTPASSGCATRFTAETMAMVGRTARADAQLAEHHGVAVHNPFVDSRVIDAYLSVPLIERPGPATYKPILRDAMRDLFPPTLADRTTKGSFTSDYYRGLRANLSTLHGLTDGTLAELGLVNPSAMRETLTAASVGLPVAFATVEPVIAAEVWLRALDTAPRVLWKAIPTRQEGLDATLRHHA